MVFNVLGRYSFSRWLQNWNAFSPISVTPSGMITSVKCAVLKMRAGIVVMLAGNSKRSMLVYWNAASPQLVSVLGISAALR